MNVNPEIKRFTGILKGEIIIKHSIFNEYLKKLGYSNVRNAASGIAKKFKGKNYAHFCEIKYHGLESKNNEFFLRQLFRRMKDIFASLC